VMFLFLFFGTHFAIFRKKPSKSCEFHHLITSLVLNKVVLNTVTQLLNAPPRSSGKRGSAESWEQNFEIPSSTDLFKRAPATCFVSRTPKILAKMDQDHFGNRGPQLLPGCRGEVSETPLARSWWHIGANSSHTRRTLAERCAQRSCRSKAYVDCTEPSLKQTLKIRSKRFVQQVLISTVVVLAFF
jgi:hypothetical protein